MKVKSFLTLLASCLLLLAPLSLCAQEPVCGKCLKKKSNCPYRCNHPTCKTCGRVCGAKVNPCPYGGKHPNPQASATDTHAGHEYVDLGLSVKWATCNVGASSPTGYGNYYAWGETSSKSSYDIANCKTWERSMSDIGGNSSYDAARANWGGSWRLPTQAECDELVNNCNYQWTTQSGVKGMRFTSKKNGNSVFFPAAGNLYGTSTNVAGEVGKYWSSTPYGSNTQYAYNLYFGSGGSAGTGWGYRNGGRSVRPVVE